MNVPLLAAGDIVIAAFAAVVAAYEGWLFFGHRREPVHAMAAAVALSTAVYAAGAVAQYTNVDPGRAQTVVRIEFLALIALALSVSGLATAVTGRAHPVPRSVQWILAIVSAAIVLGTELIVPPGAMQLNVWLLGRPYLQPLPGPLTFAFFAVFMGFAALSAGWMIWKARSRDMNLFFGSAAIIWLFAAVWDTIVSSGFLSTPLFFMEYGFTLLAASLMAVDLRHYRQLVRNSEERQMRSEESFRVMIERVPICTTVQIDGKIIYANPATMRTLGYDRREDLLGFSFLDLVHPEDRPGAEAWREQIARPGGDLASVREERIRRRDGTYTSMEVAGVPVVFEGKPAVVTMGMDVSERKDLVAKVMQMDRMIAVGTLAAGVAHEINNPLSYVIANVDFAKQILPELVADVRQATRASSGLPAAALDFSRRAVETASALEDLQGALGDALEGAERVRRIVGDLRVFSHSQPSQLEPVALPRILESAVNMAENEIRHRARLVWKLGPSPLVLANESRLEQVFLNLLVNAAQAIPDGRAEANEIQVVACTSDSGKAVVEIRDTGCGIPPEVRGRVFDPFFTTKPVGQGIGLGLSICQGILRDLGGEIAFESEVGRGTVVRVTLPAAPATASEVSGADVVAPQVGTPRRGRILVIDDEESLGVAILRILAQEHEVVALTSARAALSRLKAGETFDVIFCDLMMPDVSGMEFFGEVTRKLAHLQSRVVFFTGGAFTPQAQEFLETNPNRRLVKPFEVRELRALVNDMIR
jgi:PAS domain S-box-containing protein